MSSWGRPPTCECGSCKKCKQREYVREWYRSKTFEERRAMRASRDLELARERDRRRYHEQRKHDPRYLAAKSAVQKVKRAIASGALQRMGCEVCGHEAQAHHDDYSRPLDVRWLCTEHHAVEHNPAVSKAAR